MNEQMLIIRLLVVVAMGVVTGLLAVKWRGRSFGTWFVIGTLGSLTGITYILVLIALALLADMRTKPPASDKAT